ncbi:MAG TPA: hypothetical protein VN381_03590 [Anaerovoracaceae bacterium]|nr:hypothetical protein [Anaerovoracaceae bacterium]
MKKLLSRIKCRKGDIGVLPITIFVVLLAVGGLCNELVRFFSIQDQMSIELNRAVNLCIKTSVYDSYRRDKENQLDPDLAEDAFYDYLHDYMDLDYNLARYSEENELMYRVRVDSLDINADTARAAATGVVYAPGFFHIGTFELPFNVTSRNQRIDEL